MIIKSFEEKKINLDNQKIHLLYGENQGHINDFIDQFFKKNFQDNTYHYEESEIISDESIIFNQLQTKSFFDDTLSILLKYLNPSMLIKRPFFSKSLTNLANLS